MRRDPDRCRAGRMRGVKIFDGANTRQEQHRDPGAGHAVDRGFDPFAIGMRAESVIETRAREPIAMADLDRIDAGAIERRRDAAYVGHGVLMTDRVHAVPERDVLDVKAGAHAITGRAACDAASRSPVRRAADVMMSRFPAYFGR